jgi:hypothetical protein
VDWNELAVKLALGQITSGAIRAASRGRKLQQQNNNTTSSQDALLAQAKKLTSSYNLALCKAFLESLGSTIKEIGNGFCNGKHLRG